MEEEEQIDAQKRELDTAWDWKPQGFLFCLLHWSLVFTPHVDCEVSPLPTQGCVTGCQVTTVPGDWRPFRPAREGCSEPGSVFWFPVQPLQLGHPGSVSCKDETASRTLTARVRLWALASRAWLGSVGNLTVREKICSIKGCFPGAAISNASSTFFWVISTPGATFGRVEREAFYLPKNQFIQQIERDTVSH